MGWWTEPDAKPEIVLGDEPLDTLAEAIASFAQTYKEDLGRLPTLEELRRTLLMILRVDPGKHFADMHASVVKDIVLRKQPVPKRQSFAIGDYFTIPLDGMYWYGRIIHHGAGDHLVEIYDGPTERLLTLRQLLARKRKVVLNKHICSLPAFTRRRWQILGHEDIPKDFKYPSFYGGLLAWGNYLIWRGDTETREPKRVAMKLEPMIVFAPERIEEALRKREFGEWPEITADKKDTFEHHDQSVKFLHEYFKIPMKRPRL